MQLELLKEEKQLSAKKSKPSEVILLTTRDYEIISFVCEMKFASIEDIYEKFFKTLRDGGQLHESGATLLQKRDPPSCMIGIQGIAEMGST